MIDNKNQEIKTTLRPTIGLLIDSTIQGYEQAIWQGVLEQTKIRNVNLVTFNVASQNIEGASRELSQIVNLINGNNLQGLIVTTATILDIIPIETMNDFLAGFQPLPMVSIGVEVDGISSLVVDNYQGMRAVIDHLIEDHGYHRIAYLQMFGDNPEAQERFRGYTESLAHHKIPFDPDLIVPGEYFGLADEAVNLLIDERKTEVDAIVGFNDDMATSVMQTLLSRGFQIPGDISIAGFDDHEISRYISPPLTTSRQPLDNLGRDAVELLLTQIGNEKEPLTVNLPTQLIVRQSCGCMHPDVAEAFISDAGDRKINGVPGLVSIKDEVIAEIIKVSGSSDQYEPMISGIFDAYIETINKQLPDYFINQLSQCSDELTKVNTGNFNWHSMITTLRQYALKAIAEKENQKFTENIFQQARALIADVTQREQANLRIHAINEANLFRSFSQRLTTLSDQKSLFDMLASDLPEFGIDSCFLAINEQLLHETKQKQLLLAYTPEKRFQIPSHGILLKPGNFPHHEYFPIDRQYSFIAENIKLQNQECGFILLETGSTDGSLYRGLADQISSALENVLMIEQIEDRATKLETAAEISRAASSILDPEELIRKSVDLVKDRFNLYYAGLFLIDESRQWAELKAGTGISGASMIAENWQLEAGSSSMIGRCITTGEADIQLDIDNAPVHLRNPHLPNTKSELALPLISRGGILGALTIQSETANAFSGEDIAVLQTMADQIATSIANAQLFEQTQTALMETETLLNVSRFAVTSADFDIYIQQVLDLTLKSTRLDNGLISLINDQTNQLEIAAQHIPEPFLTNLQINGLENTLCELVFQKGTSIIVYDLTEDSPIDATGLINLGFKSYMGFPLEYKNNIFGTLCIFNLKTLTPKDTRIALLQAIGQQVAVAIENARLIEQTQVALADSERQSLRMNALNTLSEELSQAETMDDIIQAGTAVLPQIVTSDHTSFVRLRDDGQHAEFMAVPGRDGDISIGTVFPFEGTIIGEVLKSKSPIIVEDFNEENPNQADMFLRMGHKSLLVVPLIVNNEAIGTFNFGSKEANGFSERDRDLTLQLSTSMGNAIENYSLLQQTQETLAELEATQQRYRLQAWSTYNQNRDASGYRQTLNSLEPLGKHKIPEVDQAIQEQNPVVSEYGENLQITIPIMLRDQPIGAIGLQADPTKRQWTPEEIALVQEIGEQFALAAESLRLLDETQRRAARERLVAEITSKIRSSNDPQAMIQTAAQELRDALQAKRTQILFQQDEAPFTRGEE